MVPMSRVATAVMAPSGCSSYSKTSSTAFSLALFADAKADITLGSIMARWSLWNWQALALLALVSAVDFRTCSEFSDGLYLNLLVVSSSESEEITRSAVRLRSS